MGFLFADNHSYGEFGVWLQSKSIQPPSKKKIKESVPFMDGSYDFSTVGSNGEATYTERTITVVLGLPTRKKNKLHVLYSQLLEWLSADQNELIFDDIPDYYFMAEVESASTFEETRLFEKLTVTFTAEPFKIGVDYAAGNRWDTFNFEEDYLQDSSYDVVGSKTIILYNPGRPVTPVINCSVNMTVTVNGTVYNMLAGDNSPYGLKIQPGGNNIGVVGNGSIDILFRKQVL